MESEKQAKLWNRNYLKVWSANFMIFFSFMLLTPLLPLYLADTFQADKEMIGFVLSGYTLTALLVRPFSGYFVDTFPRRTVLLVSYFLFAILFAGYIVAGSLLLFAIVRTLHGAPFGASTVSNSTVAIDVLHPTRRAEGIGYYGLSNNIATAISPSVALIIYGFCHSYEVLFWIAFVVAFIGLWINSTLDLKPRPKVENKAPMSLDRFVLKKGWSAGISMIGFAVSYGILSTYLAIYGKEELGITSGSGFFFMLLSVGLILSRLAGGRTLRKGLIHQNAAIGVVVALCGYLLFALVHSAWGFYGAALIIGLGNGHLFPAFQTMFLNLGTNDQRGTANSTFLVSWDIGIGIGIIAGGSIAEHLGYHTAFWVAAAANAVAVANYFLVTHGYFERNRLR